MARHQALNDVVCRAFISAGIPASKEPAGQVFAHGMVKGQMVFNSVAKWKAFGLGRYGGVHAGLIICGSGSERIWCSGRAGSIEKS